MGAVPPVVERDRPPEPGSGLARSADGRPETELQRWDRNFTELLQELRVAQTGVQILFGFLLTVPFSNRFAQATDLQIGVYICTMLACAVAAALLIAPVSLHRQVFRRGLKAELVRRSDQLAQAGLLALVVAMSGVVFLIVDVLVGLLAACLLTAAVACVYVLLWYLLPLRLAGDPADESEDDDERPGRLPQEAPHG
jgi:hypothetical protein